MGNQKPALFHLANINRLTWLSLQVSSTKRLCYCSYCILYSVDSYCEDIFHVTLL